MVRRSDSGGHCRNGLQAQDPDANLWHVGRGQVGQAAGRNSISSLRRAHCHPPPMPCGHGARSRETESASPCASGRTRAARSRQVLDVGRLHRLGQVGARLHVAEMLAAHPAIGVICEAVDGDTDKGLKSFDDRQCSSSRPSSWIFNGLLDAAKEAYAASLRVSIGVFATRALVRLGTSVRAAKWDRHRAAPLECILRP